MVLHVDAIFTQGAFRPLNPLTLPEGTRVELRIEICIHTDSPWSVAKMCTPRLARRAAITDFVMSVREHCEPEGDAVR